MIVTNRDIPEFLSGGGETGELMRSIDWSATSLGPAADWPRSLKTCVRIILTSRQPMFVWWGTDLVNLYNDPYKAIVGGKHPEALGQPASAVWREIWDQVGPRAEAALRTNEGTYDEALLLIMERNGYPEETYYTFSYSPVPDDDGRAVGILCANTDDTGRIIGERQLRTLKDLGKQAMEAKALDEVFQKIIQVLKANPQDFPFAFLYQIENEGRQARLVGTTAVEIPEKVASPHIDLTGTDEVPRLFSEVVQSGKMVQIDGLIHRFGRLPSGFWPQSPDRALLIPIQISGQKLPLAVLKVGMNPFRLPDEKYLSFFQLVADQISSGLASVLAYEQERERAEALAEIDRAKTTFFSNISHEFRTPLTLMLGPLENLIREETIDLSDDQRRNLEATHRNAMRLLRLVNNLLDFSRIEAGRTLARFSPVDLSAATVDLAGSFRSVIETAGLQFEVRCERLSRSVFVDPEMWEKIVLNLLSNAFKYTLQGRIGVHLREEDRQAVLEVEDTGVGIPAHELPRMFERFHRIQNSAGRTHEGSGIGLSLVMELLKLHQGAIEVRSEEGRGSVFTVRIPFGKAHLPEGQVTESDDPALSSMLKEFYLTEALSLASDGIGEAADPPAEPKAAAPPAAAETAGAGRKNRVLVVDDNADMREYIGRLLGKPYEVETAPNGQAALERVRRQRPDLIVSDIMMPVMDGVELVRILKNHPDTERIPVILVSARAGEEARIEGYETGADDYLVKPFSAKELLARVGAHIRLRRKVEESRSYYRQLVESLPAAVYTCDHQGRIQLYNRKAVELWGREPEIRREFWCGSLKCYRSDGSELPVDQSPMAVALKTARPPGPQEVIIERPDGERRHILANPQPLFDPDGRMTGAVSMLVDVTDLKRTEQALRESERRFRTVADSAPVLIWMAGTDRLCDFFNAGWLRFTGRTMEQELGNGWAEGVHPDDMDRCLDIYHSAFDARTEFEMEYRLRRHDGVYRWIFDRGLPRFGPEGDFLGYIGTCMDIHELKTGREELETRVRERTAELVAKNEELEDQKEFAETILDSSVDVIAVFDREFRFLSLNRKGEELYKLKEAEVVGRKITDVFPQVVKSNMLKNLSRALEGHIVNDPAYFSAVLNRHFENFYIPLRREGDAVLQVLAIGHDHTEIIEATENLKQVNRELLRTNHELEQFAYIASHDLQEPLRKIQTFSELLTETLDGEEISQKYLEKIRSSAQRMSILIRDVLNYSRLSRADEQFEVTDPNRVLAAILADFELLIDEKQARIEAEPLPPLRAVPLQINQLFSNLISNSLKFSEGNTRISITGRNLGPEEVAQNARLNPDLRYAEIRFSDNGIGFDQQYAEQIFTIFHRLNGRNAYSGTGIGLALCRKIAENHQGAISAVSELGRGATFILHLPLA
ncbi:ATP-binding protein [Larkinella soli]|uniref:ATP-binding protein n=1 Tax=Larkinella soli TaxID=1770527 RepID=UPI0013E3E671|nr:ATP-binding protein [Larkinella soli]